MSTLTIEAKKKQIAENMRSIMLTLGLDLSDPSLSETPNRIAKMYVEEIFSGLEPMNFPKASLQKENLPKELVLVKNISFVSFCEHHFVPMIGKVHVAYFPDQLILGLSKIPSIVRYFAKRPQIQERLTAQIAESLTSILETQDVAVAIQASHFCMIARDVEDMTAQMETHVLKGGFETDPLLRSQFFGALSQPSL